MPFHSGRRGNEVRPPGEGERQMQVVAEEGDRFTLTKGRGMLGKEKASRGKSLAWRVGQ